VLKSKVAIVLYMLWSFFIPAMVLALFQEAIPFKIIATLLLIIPYVAFVYSAVDALSLNIDTSSMSKVELYTMNTMEWDTDTGMYEIMMSYKSRTGLYVELAYVLVMSVCTIIENCSSLAVVCVVINTIFMVVCMKYGLLQPKTTLVGLMFSIVSQNISIIMALSGADVDIAFRVLFVGVSISVLLQLSTIVHQFWMEGMRDKIRSELTSSLLTLPVKSTELTPVNGGADHKVIDLL
jgi:hypothetical protein